MRHSRRLFILAGVVLLLVAAVTGLLACLFEPGAFQAGGIFPEASYSPASSNSYGSYQISGNIRAAIDPATSSAPQGSFQISGEIPELFYPGVSHTLDLVLTNPESVPVTVTSLNITVDPATTKAGCDGSENLQVTRQFVGTATVPGQSTASLSTLGVAGPSLPLLTMPDLPVSQDTCQGATVILHYTGDAVSEGAVPPQEAGRGIPLPGGGAIPLTGVSLGLAAAATGALGLGAFLYRRRAKAERGVKAGRR